jgi:hypothetical protein
MNLSPWALFVPLFFGLKAAPEPRWPMLPSVSRVHVDVLPTHLIVTRDVTLPRGDFRGGELTMHVGWDATVPVAFDAKLIAAADGELGADMRASGDALPVELGSRPALPLFGSKELVGANVRVPEPLFVKALAPGNMAVLRIREVVRVPPRDENGERLLLVRLGAANGVPLTLARIEVRRGEGSSELSLVRAELCGKDAVPSPLFVSVEGGKGEPDPQAIAPVLATRHTSDDLCVRFR